jgi:hypothetical protein
MLRVLGEVVDKGQARAGRAMDMPNGVPERDASRVEGLGRDLALLQRSRRSGRRRHRVDAAEAGNAVPNNPTRFSKE